MSKQFLMDQQLLMKRILGDDELDNSNLALKAT